MQHPSRLADVPPGGLASKLARFFYRLMTLISNSLCTFDELVRKFGGDALVNWADHDADGIPEAGVIDDGINQATEEIRLYAGRRYSDSGLATSTLIERWCVSLAGYFISQSRANAAPAGLKADFERIMAHLVAIAKGLEQIPGIALRADMRPTMSNLQVDRAYRYSKIRKSVQNSSGSNTTTLTEHLIREYYALP